MTLAGSNRSRRHFLMSSLAASLVDLDGVLERPRLRASGRWFLDETDRVVLLRGVNLAGNSKVPPFRPIASAADLDALPALGFNVVRLLWIWEAFEPLPGRYDWQYLEDIRRVAAECWSRGMYVIIDVHQDGFSRNSARGSGDGFPLWAVSPSANVHIPDNGPHSRDWPVRVATDPGVHISFAHFYADRQGVRTRYLSMLRTIARAFAQEPGVIGYDLLNEPWGDERRDLAPLYEDAAVAIRGEHPSAILFIEGHIATNMGLQTNLPRPRFGNFAYAPHYYKPAMMITRSWHGGTATIANAFHHMTAKAAEWCVPLLLGEFGGPAEALNIGAYIDTIYDRLDASMASGAQWNYTPMWTSAARDGWNEEDFNILFAQTGQLRPNFRPRPHPLAVAGEPIRFGFIDDTASGRGSFFEFSWRHAPERGATEVFVPRCRFPNGATITANDATWIHDEARQRLIFTSPREATITARITGPG